MPGSGAAASRPRCGVEGVQEAVVRADQRDLLPGLVVLQVLLVAVDLLGAHRVEVGGRGGGLRGRLLVSVERLRALSVQSQAADELVHRRVDDHRRGVEDVSSTCGRLPFGSVGFSPKTSLPRT